MQYISPNENEMATANPRNSSLLCNPMLHHANAKSMTSSSTSLPGRVSGYQKCAPNTTHAMLSCLISHISKFSLSVISFGHVFPKLIIRRHTLGRGPPRSAQVLLPFCHWLPSTLMTFSSGSGKLIRYRRTLPASLS
jgi:hypothetical protein